MLDFGTAFQNHLDRIGISQRAFARKVGASYSLVQKVVAGERLPPLERLDVWLRALALQDTEIEELRWRANLAHASPWFRQQVLGLLERTGNTLAD